MCLAERAFQFVELSRSEACSMSFLFYRFVRIRRDGRGRRRLVAPGPGDGRLQRVISRACRRARGRSSTAAARVSSRRQRGTVGLLRTGVDAPLLPLLLLLLVVLVVMMVMGRLRTMTWCSWRC